MTLYTVLQVKTSWSMLQLLFKGFCNQTSKIAQAICPYRELKILNNTLNVLICIRSAHTDKTAIANITAIYDVDRHFSLVVVLLSMFQVVNFVLHIPICLCMQKVCHMLLAHTHTYTHKHMTFATCICHQNLIPDKNSPLFVVWTQCHELKTTISFFTNMTTPNYVYVISHLNISLMQLVPGINKCTREFANFLWQKLMLHTTAVTRRPSSKLCRNLFGIVEEMQGGIGSWSMISVEDIEIHAAQLSYQLGPTGKLWKNSSQIVIETLGDITSRS